MGLAAAACAAGCGAGEWEGGIHARLALQREGGLRVVEVPAGPAREAGLSPGDRVLAIDGEPVEGRTPAEVQKQLRGPVGTPVTLTIAPADGGPTRPVEVTRAPYVAR